ncbi:MAG: hypothetical protein US54_C0019G0003 [Candidatus Roizmanbacteria bacterium GW2011_GWA2_37_7]|uniref:Uncharacterized protein n=1 Tax=Candidatus Roizmanbacteria bacterium GW2011_GWA2_37_7 TaxID=1618481 RepID=A0A0G0JMK3_9BACT|nr:MAG: hypothetical protein US54_C0019G0003 [Candidatus Roizmanbacteria bacterium GW2011_GWA2_37_7]
MSNQSKILNTIIQYFVYVLVFLFPLFFLPITRDFLIYSKFYFLSFVLFIVLLLSLGKFLLTRKFTWVHNLATQSLILIVLSYILSIVLMSPNKLQAIYNPQYGLVLVMSMVLLYFYASHVFIKAKISPILPIAVSGVLVSVFALIVMVDPFQSADIPAYWSFLSNTTFNTIGSSVHFIAFLLFVLIGSTLYMWRTYTRSKVVDDNNRIMLIILGVIVLFTLLALIFHVFILSQQILSDGMQIILPPFSLSWYAAVEVLKNPMTAIFGVGVDNFSSLFTQVRTVNYNLSDLWQINSFNTSRSTLLHVLTEQGILGIIGYCLLISLFLKNLKNVKLETAGMFLTSLAIMLILPPSAITFFLFFIALAMMAADIHKRKEHEEYIIDLSSLTPIFIGMIVIIMLVLGGTVYFMGRHFMAEYYFKRSLDAIADNSLQRLYENQARALQFNNNNEEFHQQFAQTNLLVANNLAAVDPKTLTDQDRQTIAQAIQAAIVEAKAATALNPQKVTNWQTLAGVYRQIVNVAENAPVWAVSAYQQSIVLDPRNPLLRLDLGGIYYLFENFDEAQKLFEQAVSLKPDWANAHYNLAWTYYKKGIFGSAVDQMQIVVGLLDAATQPEDYKAAQKNLDDFKKTYQTELEKLQQQQAAQGGTPQGTAPAAPSELNLPSPPATQLDQKIELPEDASPGANVQ